MKRPRTSLLVLLFFSCILLGTKYYLITRAGNSTTESQILQEAITWMYNNGLTTKTTPSEFKPNETVNREQAAKFFSVFATRIYNKEINSTNNCILSDINSADKTLITDIKQACGLEIMKGNNNKFSPKKKITYAEAISTLIRIMYGKMDEPKNAYYSNYYTKAKEIGLIGNIKIKNYIKRGEIATMMYKASLLSTSNNNINTDGPIAENILQEQGLISETNKTLAISPQEIKKTNTKLLFTSTKEQYLKTNIELGKSSQIYGLSIDANVTLGDNGFVRVVLAGKEDNVEKEYLIYEESEALADQNSYSIKDSCDETCVLPENFTPQKLLVEIQENSSIQINQVNIIPSKNDLPNEVKANIKAARQQIKANKALNKLGRVKKMINEQNLNWKAGMTPIANMSYQEKKNLFLGKDIPDLAGFEFYIGGVYEKRNKGIGISSTPLEVIQNFDRRNAHGQNRITPVKNQGTCSSSRTFSVVGALEALVNIYINKNIGLNLSEQDIISNSNGGDCTSGYPSVALDYSKNYGVVDEDCFSYGEVTSPSYSKCQSPTNLIKIGGKSMVTKNTEVDIKKALIDQGPLSVIIRSWNNAVVLVGFETNPTDGTVTWIFKNSRGSSRGEYGYGKIKTSLSDLSVYAINIPVTDNGIEQGTNCTDTDGDGYCYRGISANKPSSCPASCKIEKDCNDANASIQYLDTNYNCVAAPATVCSTDEHLENNICTSNTQSCSLEGGTGTQTRTNNSRGNCIPTTCTTGYLLIDGMCTKSTSCSSAQHIENNICIDNTRSCSITNGIGMQTRNGTYRNTCTVVSCNTGYKIRNNECVINKQTSNRKIQ